jgi:hypothetical protein
MTFTTRSLLLAVLALCIAASSGVSAADTCCCANGSSSDMPSGGELCKMMCGDDGEKSCTSTEPAPGSGGDPVTDPADPADPPAGDDSKCHGNPSQPQLKQRWFETPSAKGCPGDSCSAQKGGDMWTCTCDSMAQCEAAWKRVQAAGGGGGDQPPKKDEPKDPAGCLLVGKKWNMSLDGKDQGSLTVTSLTSVHVAQAGQSSDLAVDITRTDKYLFDMIIKGVKNNPDAAKYHCDVDAEYTISFASYKCDEFKMNKVKDPCTVRILAGEIGKLAGGDDDSSNTTTIIIIIVVVVVLLGILLTVLVLKSKQKAAQTAMLMQQGGTGAYTAPQ